MADRRDDLQFDDPSRQQLQRPIRVVLRRRPEAQGDNPRLLLAIEQLRHRGRRAPLAFQRQGEALQHAPPPHILDRLRPARERVRDQAVGPTRPVRIDLEQDPGKTRLLTASLALGDRLLSDLALLFREPHDVLLPHEDSSGARNDPIQNIIL